MKKKSRKPAVRKISQKEKEFEALLQRAHELMSSQRKTGRKAGERLAR